MKTLIKFVYGLMVGLLLMTLDKLGMNFHWNGAAFILAGLLMYALGIIYVFVIEFLDGR